MQGGLNGQLSLDDDFLLLAIVLNVAVTLVVVILCWTVANIGIAVGTEECLWLVAALVNAILHILLVVEGIAIDAVIERDARGIGINRREHQAALSHRVASVTALAEHIALHRNIATCCAIRFREVDVMVFLSIQLNRLFINADNQSPKEMISCLMISALAYIERFRANLVFQSEVVIYRIAILLSEEIATISLL